MVVNYINTVVQKNWLYNVVQKSAPSGVGCTRHNGTNKKFAPNKNLRLKKKAGTPTRGPLTVYYHSAGVRIKTWKKCQKYIKLDFFSQST